MKIKILNITIVLLLVSGSCFAQTKEVVDSLKSIMATTKNDTAKIYAQIGLCIQYDFSNNDSAMYYGQQALELARQIDYIPGQILALSFLTGPAQQQGDYPKTLELGFKTIQLAQEHNLERYKYSKWSEFDFAYYSYVLPEPALTNMAHVYSDLKDYPKAINYMYQLISLELAGPSDPGLPYAYMDIGEAYLLSNQLDSAAYYEKKAVKIFKDKNLNEPAVYRNLGDIAMKSGRNKEALHYYKISERNSIEGNRLRALTWAYIRISGLFKTMDQPDSALYYAHKGFEVSQHFGQKSSSLAAAKLLSGLYEPKNIKQSLRYLKIADAYRDSLFGEANEIIEDLKHNLEKINQHGKRADSIVKGMLLHSRGTSGEKTFTDINELLEQYVNLAYHGMRAQNKGFNITIEKDYDEKLEKINVVPQDISRAFLNIINNACYAANEKKKLTGNDFHPKLKVSTKKLNDKVEIRIADNGNGIPNKIKDKIFQQFFTTKPTGEGTGLGLSLTYDIVTKAHGGELKLETKEDAGSTFIIILPLKNSES